jgi:hypothetical protein
MPDCPKFAAIVRLTMAPSPRSAIFGTYAESVKGRGLGRNNQVAASVDDPAAPPSSGPQRRARRAADPADPGSDNRPAGGIRLTGTLLDRT